LSIKKTLGKDSVLPFQSLQSWKTVNLLSLPLLRGSVEENSLLR